MDFNTVAPKPRRSWMSKVAPVAALGAVALAVIVLPGIVEASSSGGGLPWEGPLETLKKSITGPVAMVVSLLGVVACGAALIFGGEMNEFIRKIIMLVLVIALIVGAASVMSTLFGVGALVAAPAGIVALS